MEPERGPPAASPRPDKGLVRVALMTRLEKHKAAAGDRVGAARGLGVCGADGKRWLGRGTGDGETAG